MTVANIILWVAFLLGQMVYVLKRAYFSVKGPNAQITTYRAYFQTYWAALIVRASLGVIIFWTFMFYPDLFTKIVSYLGLSENLTVPKVPPMAFLGGLASDFLLDWVITKVPFLKGQVPTIPDN